MYSKSDGDLELPKFSTFQEISLTCEKSGLVMKRNKNRSREQ